MIYAVLILLWLFILEVGFEYHMLICLLLVAAIVFYGVNIDVFEFY